MPNNDICGDVQAEESITMSELDLESPIMKVVNLLRKLDEADVKMPPELHQVRAIGQSVIVG